jgi:pseudouridine kinase
VFDVVVIGGCNFDIKAKSAEANKLGTSNPGTVTTSAGGVARNISHNLARLGVKVSLISAVGRDAMGDSVLETTRAAGVDVSGVARLAGATGTYIAVLDRNGELITAMNDMQAVEHLTPEKILLDKAVLASARLVVAGCNVSHESLQVIAEMVRDKLLIEPVSVPKSQKFFKLLDSGPIAYATPNFDQIEALSGTRNIAESVAFLHHRGLRNAVIHAGPEGAFCSDGKEIDHVEAMPAGPVVDVTGAGDGAVAGLVYGLLQGKSLSDAVAEGQRLAGRIVASQRSFLE